MSGKFALIIGNTEYSDPGLAQLSSPGKDTEDFARVLRDQEIGAFDDVNILLNQPEPVVRGAIDEFFDQKKPDDLLVLYFSGHGVRDELGALFLAVKNTIRSRLRSTAVKSDYIREVMDQSRSRRQVLILDCCNSGAFAQGTKAATGVSIGTASAFEGGYGRIILTASDSTQFAWEGDKVIGETDNSLFTHYLVEGLEGEADLDGDGRITVDEMYDYAYEKVRIATPKQSPSKFSSKQQGEIVLRQSMRMEDMKPVPLPTPLLDSIENPFADVRLGAVQQLTKLLNGKNLGLAHSAREALERVAKEDDSRQVSHAAAQALESIRRAEEAEKQKEEDAHKKGKQEEVERAEVPESVEQRIESEAFANDEMQSESPNLETSNALPAAGPDPMFMMSVGWALGGAIGGYMYSEFGEIVGGTVGGAIGGYLTALALRSEKVFSAQKNITLITLAWALGGGFGWFIGWSLTEASGAGFGIGFFALIGLLATLGMDYIEFQWKRVAVVVLVWAFSGGIGWSISKGMIEGFGADTAISWGIGTAIGWGIAGSFMGWQILKGKVVEKK